VGGWGLEKVFCLYWGMIFLNQPVFFFAFAGWNRTEDLLFVKQTPYQLAHEFRMQSDWKN